MDFNLKTLSMLKAEAYRRGEVRDSEIQQFFKSDTQYYAALIQEFRDQAIDILDDEGNVIMEEIDEAKIDADNERYYRNDDILSAYAEELKQYPLLTAEQEQDYGRVVQAGLEAKDRLTDEAEVLTAEEKKTLEELVRKGELTRNYFVCCNLRLVMWWSSRFKNRGLDREDIVQEGAKGLMTAVEKFDPERGNRFSTYASIWIKKNIRRAIQNQARTVRLPVHVSTNIGKLRKAEQRLENLHGTHPTYEQLAEELGMTVEKVREILTHANDSFSLDIPIGEEENITLADLIEAPNSRNIFDELSEQEYFRELHELLLELNPREYEVIMLRFGLRDNKRRTLEEIGKIIGLTRERVRQIEAKALKKLRHPSRSYKVKQYL